MNPFRLTAFLVSWLLSVSARADEPFVVYYDSQATLEHFTPYGLVILDQDNHPPLPPLREESKKLLGYISLGEVESNRSYYRKLKAAGLVLKENEKWKNSYLIDVRNPLWAQMVIEDIIPGILAQGFDGIFIDTLDNPSELERSDPVRYRGMNDAAVRLVKAIRLNYPQIAIMMNRGYELLPRVANVIDMELGESVYATYDFDTKKYIRVKPDQYRQQVKRLKDAQILNPRMAVYVLDYWDKEDRGAIAEIYRQERANGFEPYVSTIALNEIIHEPLVPR